MSSVEEKIQDAVSQNRELLAVLAETDYAPGAFEQQQKYIADINHELNQLSTRISQLETKRKKELKDHEKYRDSVMKRFAYRVGRKTEKFEAKAEKEEREYFEALQEEHQAKQHQKYLENNLSEAQTQASQLESAVNRHKQAQSDLDALYDSIFEGPTPGFPEEDEKERAAEAALTAYHNLSMQTESEHRALQILDQAGQRMNMALKSMDEALSASQMDMFGGGAMMDMMERNALSRAQSLSTEVQMLFTQAQRMSPNVGNLPSVNIAQGNFMSDVLFDNPFTDHRFHQKIKASKAEMDQASRVLRGEWEKGQGRVGELKGRMGEEGKKLEASRVELQSAREKAFERVAGGGGK